MELVFVTFTLAWAMGIEKGVIDLENIHINYSLSTLVELLTAICLHS
jgi:hypothetical protein